MTDNLSFEIKNTSAINETAELQADTSSNPIEYAANNPMDASLILVGAVAFGLAGKWLNDRTAKDQNIKRD